MELLFEELAALGWRFWILVLVLVGAVLFLRPPRQPP